MNFPSRPEVLKLFRVRSLPFFAAHLIPFFALWTGVTRRALLLGIGLYVVRMFFLTAGYHRYFAHRSYRLARVPQFLMALGGTTAAQKGPLWWAANHRDHHKYADTDRDPHSPQQGFLWSHLGWIFSGKFDETKYENIEDFAKYPELRWLNKHDFVAPFALGVGTFLYAGWSGLVIGFFASTVVLWHGTFCVNSLAHVFGRRRYATTDTSRNSFLIALFTLGEGWHNNHHHYPMSVRQGFRWWEFDFSYIVLRGLNFAGIARDLRKPPKKAKIARRVRDGAFDLGRFREYLGRAAATLPSGESGAELRRFLGTAAQGARRMARGDAVVHTD